MRGSLPRLLQRRRWRLGLDFLSRAPLILLTSWERRSASVGVPQSAAVVSLNCRNGHQPGADGGLPEGRLLLDRLFRAFGCGFCYDVTTFTGPLSMDEQRSGRVCVR